MNTGFGSNEWRRNARGANRVLAVFSVIALALAVSPTALAKECRPGAPSARQANLYDFIHVLRSQPRSVSWSD